MEGKGVRMTPSGTDQKDQVWKQTLEKGKDDFGVSRDLQTEETQTQASHLNSISYILLIARGTFYSKLNTCCNLGVPSSPVS